MKRNVHQCLEIEKLIQDAVCHTVILCGNREAGLWPLARANVRAWAGDAPIFWVPYPGSKLVTPILFNHMIMDPSFDTRNQFNVDWFEAEVMERLMSQCKVTRLAA